MSTLLHVPSRPWGAASESLALTSVFLDSHREVHPEVRVETLDLWQAGLGQGVPGDREAIPFQPPQRQATISHILSPRASGAPTPDSYDLTQTP